MKRPTSNENKQENCEDTVLDIRVSVKRVRQLQPHYQQGRNARFTNFPETETIEESCHDVQRNLHSCK